MILKPPFWQASPDEVSSRGIPTTGLRIVMSFSFDRSRSHCRRMGNLMRTMIFLAVTFAVTVVISQVDAQEQVCANNCIKNYNACIAQCGGTRAGMPWEPVAKEKLTAINDCVRSQCRDPLNTCQGDCGKPGGSAKRK
jgi:hypothetical protein